MDIKQDICLRILNIDYVILFKRLIVDCDEWPCRRRTPRDDSANGAHTLRGSTERGSCTDKSELCIFYIICAAWLIVIVFFRWKVFQSWSTRDHPCQMTPQKEHTTRGSTDGGRNKQTTPRIRIQWWMMQQTEHTVYSAASHEPMSKYQLQM